MTFKFKLDKNLRIIEENTDFLPTTSSLYGGRNGGVYTDYHSGRSYRVGQIHGFLHYGAGIALSTFDTDYVVDVIELDHSSKYRGLHTLNNSEEFIVFDVASYKRLNSV
jgi:hypothetical protein